MRAALLPTTGDPFVVGYWMRNFATWRDEVDELVVLVNTGRGGDDLAYCRRVIEEGGGRFVHADLALGHGGAIKRLLDETGLKSDHLVLCEEDAFVRKEGEVDLAFEVIEGNAADVIGSPRFEDEAGDYQAWGPYTPGDPAEMQHALWPAMLFARRADLRRTSQQFGDRKWKLGEEVAGFGKVTEAICEFVGVGPDLIHLETFAGTTFELRAAGLYAHLVHHTRLFDLPGSREGLAADPPWFHVTGSTQLPFVLEGTPTSLLPDFSTGGGQWVRRLAWWERIVGAVEDAPGRRAYQARLAAFRDIIGINEDDIAPWSDLFDRWVTWDETREKVAA